MAEEAGIYIICAYCGKPIKSAYKNLWRVVDGKVQDINQVHWGCAKKFIGESRKVGWQSQGWPASFD